MRVKCVRLYGEAVEHAIPRPPLLLILDSLPIEIRHFERDLAVVNIINIINIINIML